MKLTKKNYIGIVIGLLILIADILLLRGQPIFFFMLGLAVIISGLPFLLNLLIESGHEREKEEMFLEFCRDLAESVNAGIPITKAINNVSEKDFGNLSKHVKKLSNQISLGIPVRRAFEIFSRDSKNNVIKSGVSIIIEAEESGGEIASTLESVSRTIKEVEDLKKERKSSVYNQIVQGYIIFLTFIAIMLILQLWLLPELAKTLEATGTSVQEIQSNNPQETIKLFNKIFLILIVLQGLFTGLVIGKLSEGDIKSGLKHSVFLMALSYMLITGITALNPAAPASEISSLQVQDIPQTTNETITIPVTTVNVIPQPSPTPTTPPPLPTPLSETPQII